MSQKSLDEILIGSTPENIKYISWAEYASNPNIKPGIIKKESRDVKLREN